MRLKNKLCVITGASAGIGKASAIALAEQGADLVLGARRMGRLEQLAEDVKEAGAGKVRFFALDVCSDQSVDTFCEKILEFGTPDVLLNNAGMAAGVDHLSNGSIQDWQKMIDTNLVGVLRVTRGLLPAMKEAQRGLILMLGSIAGHYAYEGGGVYCATKHALQAITKTLKLELCGQNIRVSSIDPGMVETEFSQVRLNDEEKAKKVYDDVTPLTAQDIAECVTFIATRPAHVNIDDLVVMPTQQATVYKVARDGKTPTF